MEYAVETHRLSKNYKDTRAVNGLDLTIKNGEIFALLGVNGSGKSTTIRMLCGLSEPSSGEALLCGINIAENPSEAKKILNVSPQETAVAPNLSVRENLELMAGIYGVGAHEARERASRQIERLSLGQVADKKAKKLSGGWQRRLSIAMALISEPEILFLDEPTLGLDVLARRELWGVIEGMKGSKTVILTTHYLDEACALADRIGIMANGSLKACGTEKELLELSGCVSFEDAFVKLCSEAEKQ